MPPNVKYQEIDGWDSWRTLATIDYYFTRMDFFYWKLLTERRSIKRMRFISSFHRRATGRDKRDRSCPEQGLYTSDET